MPPNVSKVVGDMAVIASSNTALHGAGKLTVRENLELDASAGTPAVKTLTQPLAVSGATTLSLASAAGNVSVLPVNVGSTGSVVVTAESAGSVGVTGGSAGVTLTTTNSGNMSLVSNGNLVGTITGTNTQTSSGAASLISSSGAANLTSSAAGATVAGQTGATVTSAAGNVTLTSTTGAISGTAQTGVSLTATTTDVVLTSTAANFTASGATSATVSSAATAAVQAPTVNVGTTDSTALTLGRNATTTTQLLGAAVTLGDSASTVTIPGNFVVSGTTTSVNTTNTTVSDHLFVLNEAPAAAGRDSGLVLKRHATDVVGGTANVTTTVASDVSVSDTVINVTAAGAIAAGWIIRLDDSTNQENFTVVSVATNAITVSAGSSFAFLAATPTNVTAYAAQANALLYDESADEWVMGYTNGDGTETTLAVTEYASLRCKSVIATEGITSSNSGTLSAVSVADNAGSGGGAALSGLKQRGSYQLIVESTAADGAAATFFISKRAAADTAAAIFTASSATANGDEVISVEWPASSTPNIYHSTLRTGASGASVTYNVYYQTV